MEFETLTETLDTYFKRQVVSINTYKNTISYTNPNNTDITIDETEYTNPQRLCFLTKNNTLYLYINTIGNKYHKISVNDIEEIEC